MTERVAACSCGRLTALTSAEPAFPPPRVSVRETTRHPWVGLPDGMEHVG